MNSGFLAAVAIMAISIFAFGANESKFFIDEEGQFSFSFSGDWGKLDKKGEKVDGHFVVARDGKAVAEVLIAHEVPKKRYSLDEYVDNAKARIAKTEGYTKINEEKGFKIGGFPAAWILMNAVEKDVNGRTSVKKLSQYIIKKDNAFWGISIVASEIDADVITEIQRTMVKSFEFGTGSKVSLDPLVKGGTKIVFDADRRYFIRVPASWKLVETGGPELTIESDIGKMHVFALPMENTDAKKEANDFIVKNERLEKCHVINDVSLKVGSEKGRLINYEGEKSGNTYHVQLALIPKDELGFYLYFISSQKKWKEKKALITGVQSTFSFINKTLAEKGKTGLPKFLEPSTETSKVEKGMEKTTLKTEAGSEILKVSSKLLWEPFSKDNVPK